MRMVGLNGFIGAAVLAAACGDNFAGPDAQVEVDAPPGFSPAPHTALPLALPHGHVVLDHPKLVTLTYSDYADKAKVEAWGDSVFATSWYTAVTAEYGVGTGTHDTKFTMGPAPTTQIEDTDLEAQITALINGDMVPKPLATGNEYLYMIYVPSTVPLGPSLQGYYGYHAQLTVGGVDFPYAVILDDGSGIDTTTSTAAHELIEAATDPLFAFNPNGDGWYTDPPLPDPWYLIEGEVADLCSFDPLPTDGGFAQQRIWSNAEAAANRNPCIPNTGDPYYTVSAEPATMPKIAKGTSATFTLTGWSTAEVPDWTIETYDADFSDLSSAQMKPQLSATTINNGRTATLTLHAPANAQSGSLGGVYILSGPYERPWSVGFIVQ